VNSTYMSRYIFTRTKLHVAGAVLSAALALLLLDVVFAQSDQLPLPGRQQQSAGNADSATATPTPLTPIGLLSPTVASTNSVEVTVAVPLSDSQELTDTLQTQASDTEQNTETISAATDQGQTQTTFGLQEAEPLSGTIVSNRTNYGARFFLEGQVYRVGPFASISLELPRSTAVLTLFTCDAETPETQVDCFWDPYLLERDGFYEIVDESIVVGLPSLMIQNPDAPPDNQVWIHNRTGITESVVYQDVVNEVAPGAVQEFDVEVGAPVIVYVRSCASLNGEQVCEWAPNTLDTGSYFAMVEVSTPGGVPGSRINVVDLRPVLDAGGEALVAAASVTCDLRVPALNIRSGPGLQYQIVGKIRSSENEVGQVSVTGRSADDLWYTVAESISDSGWVTSNPDFMACRTSTDDLPIAEFTGAPLSPTSTPVPVAVSTPSPEQPVTAQEPVAEADEQPVAEVPEPAPAEPEVGASEVVTPTEESTGSDIPEGLAMLVVNNGFQHPMRFTVDQIYRPVEGPSEFDLEPGESTNLLVFPGTVAFTASSPWNGLSGNENIEVGADQSAVLWLRFEPEPEDSSQWYLAWE
jgi:uncharacterized protein YraI